MNLKMRFVVPVVALGLILGVSACGGDAVDELRDQGYDVQVNPDGSGSITGNGGVGGGVTSTDAQLKALEKMVECMRAKGYDMPDPDPDNPVLTPRNAENIDRNKVNADSQECVQQELGLPG